MKKVFSLKKSIGLRMAVVAVLVLILLIPATMINDLVVERQQRRYEAIDEISAKWGHVQTIRGPVLSIPFSTTTQTAEGPVTRKQFVHFMPEQLNIGANIMPDVRYRGIFEAILYTSELNISGRFDSLDFAALNIRSQDIQWHEAVLSIGINDLRGLNRIFPIDWNGEDAAGHATTSVLKQIGQCIQFQPEIDGKLQEISFSTRISLKGSTALLVAPLSKETAVTFRSTWRDPSFTGSILPVNREITQNGFRAEWQTFQMNQSVPLQWRGHLPDQQLTTFGVELMLPVDSYRKTDRSLKYAIMFLALTFLSFFAVEVITGKALHPVQYLFVGLELLVFYSLLLSFSEHLGFDLAYILASLGIIITITAYALSILRNRKYAVLICAQIASLYSYMYVVLQLEDYALLIGSLGLFAILGAMMLLTRKLDWYAVFQSSINREQ